MQASLDDTYGILSDHRRLQEVVPSMVVSALMRSSRPHSYVAEEQIRLGGRLHLCMVRHQLSPPHMHKYYVIGGDAKGSTITEDMHESRNGTDVTATINWKKPWFTKNTIPDTYQEMLQEVARYLKSQGFSL